MFNQKTAFMFISREVLPVSPENVLYIFLLSQAVYRPHETLTHSGTDYRLYKGQLLYSLRQLEEQFSPEMGFTIAVLRRLEASLVGAGLMIIERGKGRAPSIVTLPKYGEHTRQKPVSDNFQANVGSKAPKLRTLEEVRESIKRQGLNLDAEQIFSQLKEKGTKVSNLDKYLSAIPAQGSEQQQRTGRPVPEYDPEKQQREDEAERIRLNELRRQRENPTEEEKRLQEKAAETFRRIEKKNAARREAERIRAERIK